MKNKNIVYKIYNQFVKKLEYPSKDIFIETSFGETHILETGNLSREPLLFLHGGNILNPANILMCKYLLKDFHIFSPDIVGHSGKSSEIDVSVKNYDYGKWLAEVISDLNFENMKCFGMSYGAGIVLKAMCTEPSKIQKACLVVPSALKNAPMINSIKLYYPFIVYLITKNDKWIKKMLEPLYFVDIPDEDVILGTMTCIKYGNLKKGIPTDVDKSLLKDLTVPTLIFAAENDILFPSKLIIPYVKENFKNASIIELIERGHMDNLRDSEIRTIIDFLKE